MMMICYILAILLALPAALLVGCAVIEAHLIKNRPQMSWLLPLGVRLASALIQQRVDGGSGLNTLLWSLPACCGRYALYGTAAGAVIGAVLSWFSASKELSPT